ncbi:MAG: DNA repair protein RecN [Actinomycetota bacterium]
MLRELHIAGLGVIDDVDLELDPGLNVLTGETGAGKTMVTVGLSLLLGRRASSTLVRSGTAAAKVGARFDGALPGGAEEWIDDPAEGLVLTRSVSAEGKSSVRIGGQMATVTALAALGPDLVEVHGQHDAQRLLQPAAQAGFLDRFVGADHLSVLEGYRAQVRALAVVRVRLDELATIARDREREIDLLAYQVREIEGVAPGTGELAELEAGESRLAHAERLVELAASATAGLADDGGAGDGLRAAAAALDEAAALDASAAPLAQRAAALAAEASELARDAREHAEALAIDPEGLEQLRGRISLLRDLRRKYGDDETAVLAYLEEARARLSLLEGADDERRDLTERRMRLEAELATSATVVTAGRHDAAPALARSIEREIVDLGMQGATIELAFNPLDEPSVGGPERVEILLAAGPGQRALPLGAAASGGELSRVMLACRSVLADLDEVPTLVFDEVDAGIGGTAGVAVGRRLARIAVTRQVVVVTHLPQIAAFADRQFSVRKRGGTARVAVLDPDARIRELSRMLSGLPDSDSAAVHAEELLAEATRSRGATD